MTDIYAIEKRLVRFHPYKPNSTQAKSGVKGRWQTMNDYGGWENCPAPYQIIRGENIGRYVDAVKELVEYPNND